MTRLMLPIVLGALLVHAPAPTVRPVEFVFVLFGGNPASATPRLNLTHGYGENLPAAAAKVIATLNNTYATMSYGHMQAARGAVYGYLTLPIDAPPRPDADCDQGQVYAAASALIPAQTPGSSRWFYPPPTVRCGNADGSFPGGYTEHEFGHNIGFMHEHNLRQNGSSFSTEEYGYRSVMGQGINLGAEMKDHALGGSWFDSTYSIASVTAPQAQDVVLTAYDEMTRGIKALKVLAPTSPPRASGPMPLYYVEFRPGRQGGPDEVLVHNAASSLLDLDPGPGDKWSLDPGDVKCWTNPTVCLSNLGYGRGPTARIRVTFDTAPPTGRPGPPTPG